MKHIAGLTGYHIAGIQRIIVLNEAEAVHQLHLGDIAGAILGEMGLDIFLRHCEEDWRVSGSPVS